MSAPALTIGTGAPHLAALTMLVQAVAGQAIALEAGPPERDAPTHADPRGLRILIAPGLLAQPLAAQRQAVVTQALLLAAGSLLLPGLARLSGKPLLTERYLQWELARGLHLLEPRLPLTTWQWLRTQAAQSVPSSAEESLDWAGQRQRATGAPPWPAHLGSLRPAQAWRDWRGQASHAWATARRVKAAAEPAKPPAGPNSKDEAEEDPLTSKVLGWFSAPLGGGALGSRLLQLLGLDHRAPGLTRQPSEPVATAQRDEHDVPGGSPPSSRHRSHTHLYPEWFDASANYRKNWVHVQEFTPTTAATAAGSPSHAGESQASPATPLGPGSGADRLVRRQLARLGLTFERHRRQADGQDLDLDALVAHLTEGARSGQAHRLYQAARRTRRDLTLLVLLDISHSTGDANPQGLRIIDQQIALARSITLACTQLGDRVAVIAFNSWGRHGVQCPLIKDFNERPSRQTEARLRALAPAGMTRIGAAIRHGAAHLAQQTGHSHRVMLLLSDGFAYDDEYEGRHAQLDTARALSEAQAAGMGCVCLNVGSQQDDRILRTLYGPSAYLRCADAQQAVPALRRLMRHALSCAGRPASRTPFRP